MISGPLKWHGSKSYLAGWHESLLPPIGSYTTRIHAYAGGLNELWDWPHEGIGEIVNDLNQDLTIFWNVLRNKRTFRAFRRQVQAIPFSQPEWEFASTVPTDRFEQLVHRAVAFFVRYRQSRQGLGKSFATLTRRRTRRGMQEQVSAWLSAVEGLPEAHKRIMRVLVLNMPALDLIEQQDDEQAFFYLDPPYLHETRVTTDDYEHEMTLEDHDALLCKLVDVKGKVMLCGYRNDLYDMLVDGFNWIRHEMEIDNKASSKAIKDKKIECVYCNYF